MSNLTGSKDTDKAILMNLTGNNFLNMCQVNKHMNSLCKSDKELIEKKKRYLDVKKQLYEVVLNFNIIAPPTLNNDRKKEKKQLLERLAEIDMEDILDEFDQINDKNINVIETTRLVDNIWVDRLSIYVKLDNDRDEENKTLYDVICDLYTTWTT